MVIKIIFIQEIKELYKIFVLVEKGRFLEFSYVILCYYYRLFKFKDIYKVNI